MNPLFPENAVSLVKEHLTPALFNDLKGKRTKNEFTLEQAIQSGIQNPDSSIGIYAGDAESYRTFSKIFDPVIESYHGCPGSPIHRSDLTRPDLSDSVLSSGRVRSFRIRVARNIANLPFPPLVGSTDREKVEERTVNALQELKGDLGGSYYPLGELTGAKRKELAQKHLLFEKGDRFMEAAGINRDWPDSRGIFVSNNQKFAVWINEEDHLRIISMDKSGDMMGTFDRLSRALVFLEKRLTFARDPRLGYLTSCPSNLGTGMRAGVHMHLPDFNNQRALLNTTAEKYNLQIRGSHGEKTEVLDGIVDISNRQRLGITEKQCIETLHRGVCAIIRTTGTDWTTGTDL
ncbi:MAG: arginine kinase [Desulfobacteraceae bacterium]|nr:arginine kinase [Desulfobacteraceae bacterium]